jgi:hypothetical protein
MSFDLIQVHKLKAQGGQVWDEYQRLVAEADAAMHDSPAHKALGEFQQQWEANSDLLTERVRALVVARIEAAEAAARAAA